MKTWKIATILGLATIVFALFASTAFGYMGGYGGYGSYNTGTYGGMMGRGGMMGGYGGGYYTNPQAPYQQGTTTPYQAVYPFQFGGGCMGRFGYGGYSYGYNTPASTYTGSSVNITSAVAIAQNYVASIGIADLAVVKVVEYSNNFYIIVEEKSTGTGAFELTTNRYTGAIYPAMGPSMMWNTKYGMMRGGILSGLYGTPTTIMPLTSTQAVTAAEQYLATYLPTATTGETTTFYGYYSIEVLVNGLPYGLVSVNGYTGQVWLHNWYGTFVQEIQVS